MKKIVLRLLERSIAGILLLAVSPLLVLLIVIIILESRGAPWFLQKRMGKDGAIFTIYKLRTMYVHDELPEGQGLSCIEHRKLEHVHVTAFGRLLRRCHLDELPQLINIVKGDMAFVGPRPFMPSLIQEGVFYAPRDCSVWPGITGLWQISSPHTAPLHVKEEYEREYCLNKSPYMDLKIIMKTPFFILNKKYPKHLL